jgi:hypothetical protein
VNGSQTATDLSIYREAYLTFKDNDNYAVRIKSAPLYGTDAATKGEISFTVLSYDAQQARKIKQKNFLISVIRDYPDKTSDESVIYSGTWDLFEKSAELEYNTVSAGVQANLSQDLANVDALTKQKATLTAEVAALQDAVSSKESEKSSLETTLNANLAKLSSLKTSGRTIDGMTKPGQGAQAMQNDTNASLESGQKANIAKVIPEVATPSDVAANLRRGAINRTFTTTDPNANFK